MKHFLSQPPALLHQRVRSWASWAASWGSSSLARLVSGHGQASSESRQRSPRGRLGSRPSSGKKSLWDLAAPPTPPDSTRETFRVGDLVWLNFAITLHRTCCWGWGPSACLVSLPRGFCHFQAPASPGDAAQLGAGQCRPSVNQTSLTRPSPRFPSGDRVPQAPGGL